MASALQVGSSYNPMSFEEYWKLHDPVHAEAYGDPNSLFAKIGNFFSGRVTSAKQGYQNYLDKYNADWNAEQSALKTQQDWQREDTQPLRQKEAMEEAGFNPMMLYAGGGSSALTIPSSQSHDTQYQHKTKLSEKDESKLAGSALKVLALLVLKKMI